MLFQEKNISVDNTHNKTQTVCVINILFSKPHNNSGNLSAGSILSTQLTQRLAHTAWYCRPPYVSLAHCSSLTKSWLVASTSNKQTPHARNWATWSSDFRMPFLKSRSLSSGYNVFTNTFVYGFVFLKRTLLLHFISMHMKLIHEVQKGTLCELHKKTLYKGFYNTSLFHNFLWYVINMKFSSLSTFFFMLSTFAFVHVSEIKTKVKQNRNTYWACRKSFIKLLADRLMQTKKKTTSLK